MVNNLFSIFDPSTSFISSIWIIPIYLITYLILSKNKKTNKKIFLLEMLTNLLKKEVSDLIEKKAQKYSKNFIKETFLLIFFINIISIFPFNFTITAHISNSFTLALILWSSLIVKAWLKNFSKIIIHLVPTGTPIQLINFIVIIEIIRNIIRPITLSVRLTANIVARHLLITLLIEFSLITKINTYLSTAPIITLISLETIVTIVQAYVLVTLTTLYHNETL